MLPKLTPAGKRRLLRMFSNEGRVLYHYDYDQIDRKHILIASQDVGPILEDNRRLYNEGDGYSPSREWRRAARIPNTVIEHWMRMGINAFREEDQPKIMAMLDSPEYLKFRTAPGRLSRRPVRCYFRASTPSGPKRVQSKGPLILATS